MLPLLLFGYLVTSSFLFCFLMSTIVYSGTYFSKYKVRCKHICGCHCHEGGIRAHPDSVACCRSCNICFRNISESFYKTHLKECHPDLEYTERVIPFS